MDIQNETDPIPVTNIDINDAGAVQEFGKAWPRFSIEEIRAAIQSAGPGRAEIEAFLQRGNPSKSGELR